MHRGPSVFVRLSDGGAELVENSDRFHVSVMCSKMHRSPSLFVRLSDGGAELVENSNRFHVSVLCCTMHRSPSFVVCLSDLVQRNPSVFVHLDVLYWSRFFFLSGGGAELVENSNRFHVSVF